MLSKMTVGERLFQLVLVAFISLMCAAMMYPFIHVLALSLSSYEESLRPGIHLYPRGWSLDAYKRTFASGDIFIAMGNSVFRTVVGTALSIFAMALGAYPLSKKYLPHRAFYTTFIVFTMFFSGGLIPSYLLIKALGLMDSRWVLIIPTLFSTFTMFIMRNFFMSIPAELEESARMDGANDVRILLTIIMPLSKPILATVALWTAVAHWNAWFDALLYISDHYKMVLQLYLRKLIIENQEQAMQTIMLQTTGDSRPTPETIKAAVLMIATVPIVIVYPFLQKYFVKGIMVGSLKG
ncbi:ABC transporter permease subunit [Paenibacillus sp. LMG 31461]|jgi:putative aldouronate transport system permease protein|uniref:ABC transporter permease subunit n=1 Tax=Paenibacillus plantarum TaxID=2654975 RepID=A0ABX1XLN9_9BACL|nr:carbohydrate ABC transporter permease [Paenibacillus plantarum]NOU69447.1 ABC transporter permease subunit [Paenibacillus plantarum]